MKEVSLQDRMFRDLKEKYPPGELMDSLMLLWDCQKDAVYRRLKGNTRLTPDELSKVAIHFGLSVDRYIFESANSVLFTFNAFSRTISNYEDYILSILEPLEKLRSIPMVKIHYASLEVPIFYYCFFPELITFKLYVWSRSVWDLPHTRETKFSFDLIAPSGLEKAQRMLQAYLEIPSLQMWSLNIIDNTLSQIEYHIISGRLKNNQDSYVLLNCLDQLINHMESMAAAGKKRPLKGSQNRADLEIYHNEMIYTNNTILVDSPYFNGIFTSFGNPNFLFSSDDRIIDYTKVWFKRVLDKASPLTLASEKNRNWYFQQLRKKVQLTRARIDMHLS